MKKVIWLYLLVINSLFAADVSKYNLTLKFCEDGNATACWEIGTFYEFGLENITKDKNKAIYFYEIASNKRHAMSKYNLARYYEDEAKDLKKAFNFYKELCDNKFDDSWEKSDSKRYSCGNVARLYNKGGYKYDKSSYEAICSLETVLNSLYYYYKTCKDFKDDHSCFLFENNLEHMRDSKKTLCY